MCVCVCLDFLIIIFVIGSALKDCTTWLILFISSAIMHIKEQTSWCLIARVMKVGETGSGICLDLLVSGASVLILLSGEL